MFDTIKPIIQGFVKIIDDETGEILLERRNAVHYENMSIAIARSLANKPNGSIYEMVFGNGGSSVNGLGIVTYLPPNVQGQNADLYNQTYSKVVDTTDNESTSYINVVHQTNALFTDIVITCLLEHGDGNEVLDGTLGQNVFDDSTDMNGRFMFDEIGLKTQGDNGEAILLTHVIFNTLEKSLNRSLRINYVLRIQMV